MQVVQEAPHLFATILAGVLFPVFQQRAAKHPGDRLLSFTSSQSAVDTGGPARHTADPGQGAVSLASSEAQKQSVTQSHADARTGPVTHSGSG